MDFSNLSKRMDSIEVKIIEFKSFYKSHLIKTNKRENILEEINKLNDKFKKYIPTHNYSDTDKSLLYIEAEDTLKKYFDNSVLKLFNKELPPPKLKNEIPFKKDSLFQNIGAAWVNSNNERLEKNKAEWNYKSNFLIFLHDCLKNYGLHPNIRLRNLDLHKRYNVVLEGRLQSKDTVQYKMLLKNEVLIKSFLEPYERKLPVMINGKLFQFKNIHSINITSSLLLDDEIELFGLKKGFIWNEHSKDIKNFIKHCIDETDILLKNPYLVEAKNPQANKVFVGLDTINQLKLITNDSFDLTRLIGLCEELNSVFLNKNMVSTISLIRIIIDHIPPIFNCQNFNEVANNYSKGSFKKSMLNLNNSLRNIADNHIHSQVRKKEVLPTSQQTSFIVELDLLLAEIIRILK